MMMADTPSRSSVRTWNTRCSTNPPVSPSRIMGLVDTSMICWMVSTREEKSTSSMSGFPLAVESHRLETHMASKLLVCPSDSALTVSTMRAVRPLWASMTRI